MSRAGGGADYSRILMTGGSGFVGGHLGPEIARAWPTARRVNLVRPGAPGQLAGWENVAISLFDEAGLKDLVARLAPELVLHLAAQSSVGSSLQAGAETWRVNVLGTFNLAAACAELAPASTLLYASSAEVYGLSFLDGQAREDSPLRPLNVYGRSKAAAEAMLGDVLNGDQRLIVVRPFNHTGPGQDVRFVLPSFAAQISAIERGTVPARLSVGNLAAEREFLDVRDVCRAYISLCRAAPSLAARETFNIASGQPHRIGDLLERMRRMSSIAFEIEVDPARVRPSEIARATGAAERIRMATGWSSETDVDALLASLLGLVVTAV